MNRKYKIPSKTEVGELCVYEWIPERPKAVLQIAHGMVEHMQRYDAFACYLNRAGVAVVGNDIAGHGLSVPEGGVKGYFGKSNGWDNIVEDMRAVFVAEREKLPGIPYVIMGHSMGSFLAETYAARYSDADGFIFSGTSGKNPAVTAGRFIAKLEIALRGGKKPSGLLNKLSFGTYNAAFKPNRTEFDWLTRDEAEVDKYIADEMCGFVFTAAAFRDLFDGLAGIAAKDWPANVAHKPIFIFSGAEDPVGGCGKGVKEIAARLENAGHDVVVKLYTGARHELLNDPDRLEAYADILGFIEGLIK